MERLNRGEIIFKVIAYLLTTCLAIVALYPIIYAFSASISGKVAYESGMVTLFPVDIQFDTYKKLYNDNSFWVAYSNTIFYTLFGTVWSMFISSIGAYALSKRRLLFRRQFNFIIVFTMWFSAGMVPLYLNYTQLHVDNRWGMIIAFGVQAYNIILLRNQFSSVPTEIEEAAIVDGASEFQVFKKIYCPMSSATVATVTLFYAISRWNGYYWASMLVENNEEMPLQVYLRQQIENFQSLADTGQVDLPYAMDSFVYAIIICSIIPVLVIYPYIQKYFAKGVNLGGVKG